MRSAVGLFVALATTASRANAQEACEHPESVNNEVWCVGGTKSFADCDRDGTLDAVCTSTPGSISYVGSAGGCDSANPIQGCPDPRPMPCATFTGCDAQVEVLKKAETCPGARDAETCCRDKTAACIGLEKWECRRHPECSDEDCGWHRDDDNPCLGKMRKQCRRHPECDKHCTWLNDLCDGECEHGTCAFAESGGGFSCACDEGYLPTNGDQACELELSEDGQEQDLWFTIPECKHYQTRILFRKPGRLLLNVFESSGTTTGEQACDCEVQCRSRGYAYWAFEGKTKKQRCA